MVIADSSRSVRTVDLFSGCGGLSLGFELHRGDLTFDTVMALDNDPAVINVFNANHPADPGTIPIGRRTDLTWFSHPGEVLLHYLIHCSMRDPEDRYLRTQLTKLSVDAFLGELRDLDEAFASRIKILAGSPSFKLGLENVTKETFTLAITRSYFKKLSISSIRSGELDFGELPWREEYNFATRLHTASEDSPGTAAPSFEIESSVYAVWDDELLKLLEASGRVGKGQHSVVQARLSQLVKFMAGPQGLMLRSIWCEWRASRDALRARFTLEVYSDIRRIYENGYAVELVLGGPPCKGFSRIARPVMESLRAQGVSAWTSHEFGDERNALMYQYGLFLRALKPAAFLFENVSNFTSTLKTPGGTLDATAVLEDIINDLANQEVEYSIVSEIVRASEHGVPQYRNRFIMVGINAANSKASSEVASFFPLPLVDETVPLHVALSGLEQPKEFGPGKAKTMSLSRVYSVADSTMPSSWYEYLRWVQQGGSSQRSSATDAHVYRRLREDDLGLLKRFGPGQRWMDYSVKHSSTLLQLKTVLADMSALLREHKDLALPSGQDLVELTAKLDDKLALRLLLENIEHGLAGDAEHHLLGDNYLGETKGHGDWFERLPPSRPCKTIIAHIGKDTYSYFHPYENRAITIREAARVQAFPDFFEFGSVGVVEGYSMIGNAVPPLLAKIFAKRLEEIHHRTAIFSCDDHDSNSVSLLG